MQKASVTVLDVGQGDSILVQAYGRSVLIDGGPDSSVLERLGEWLPFWQRRVDAVISTHPHDDHLFGLLEVLERYEVGYFVKTGIGQHTAYGTQHTAEEVTVDKSKRLKIGDVVFDFVYPRERLANEEVDDLNNTSIVIRVEIGEQSYLFTGDAEKEVEEELIENSVYLESDVLKVGHHGSKTSTTENFLRAVGPNQAAISCGVDNRFGHPKEEILEKLRSFDIEIRRTDEEGDVELTHP